VARIRAFPHLVASDASVAWSGWLRRVGDAVVALPTQVEGWDYAQSLDLETEVWVDAQEFVESTGLHDLSEVRLVATVDCPSTNQRHLSITPLTEFLARSQRHVTIHIPSGSVANDINLAVHIALASDMQRQEDGLTASEAGARLASSPTTRVYLEGSASRFPTEAISFSAAQMEEAAWSIRIRFDDLRESFAGSVRLLLNSDHPVGSRLASMDETVYGAVASFLRLDIIRALLGAVADHLTETGLDQLPLDEDSIGAVMSELCVHYLGKDFVSVAELRRSDPARFERVLQEGVGISIGAPR